LHCDVSRDNIDTQSSNGKGKKKMTTSNLETQKVKFARHTAEDIAYTIKDIKETLAIWIDSDVNDPYVAALYSEFDYLINLKR
jgi:uncharacterized FlaG/YvyC family protein